MPIHKTHPIRFSDSSWYDYKCTRCGATDIAGDGWGKLAEPCPFEEKKDDNKESLNVSDTGCIPKV